MLSFFIGIAIFACYIAGACYTGFIFSTIWGYFIVPLGMKALSIPHAMGIMTIVAFPLLGIMTKLEYIKPAELTFDSFAATIVKSLALFTFVWGYAAVLHSFM